ncbi:hypothetical protein V5O48_000591 [Marasmius crinis-equi]|uniref:enoyl-[acyl-carrier-protein] reductase n=1 Tax=Marasmius crinis-equi TaxID=585013 RepID=A0ABR3G0T6_9AGAR
MRLTALQFRVARYFSSATISSPNRALAYNENGPPHDVLRVVTSPRALHPPTPNTVNIEFILAPINPVDINTVEGVYPVKPKQDDSFYSEQSTKRPIFVGGKEGLARVVEVGEGVQGLKKDDWVVAYQYRVSTWTKRRNVSAADIIKLPYTGKDGLSEVNGACITINPPTAYNVLRDFVDLQDGDWVLQNGANSAVGQMVLQIAKSRKLNTINFVRARTDLASVVHQLKDLGATKVLTYDDLLQSSFRKQVDEWTSGRPIRLALNCVSGPTATAMAKLLGEDAHLVSYGAMSKQPLSLPTSLLIFKNLTAQGFSQAKWNETHSRADFEALVGTLAGMMLDPRREGSHLKEPVHKIMTIRDDETDEVATAKVRKLFRDILAGGMPKMLLRWE